MAQIVFILIGIALFWARSASGFPRRRSPASSSCWRAALVFIVLQRRGLVLGEKLAERFLPAVARQTRAFREAVQEIYEHPMRLAASSAIHLAGWILSAGGTWLAVRLIGGRLDIAGAIAIESILCALRSAAVIVPGALGVQEAGYARMLMPLFGLSPETGLAVSLLKRAREIALGAPVAADVARAGRTPRFRRRRTHERYLSLVTGASGFVGSAVARALIGRGFQVRVLMRPTSPRTNIADLDAEIAEGDMRDERLDASRDEGRTLSVPRRADYRLWARDMEEIVRNNRGRHAHRDGSGPSARREKVVYTSSVATLKPIAGQSVDETSRHDTQSAIGAYKRSKVVAEQVVEHMIATQALPATIVSPSDAYRPARRQADADRAHPRRSSDRAHAGLCRHRPQPRHVDDVAEGHLLALDKGRIGERYILGGQDATLAEMPPSSPNSRTAAPRASPAPGTDLSHRLLPPRPGRG